MAVSAAIMVSHPPLIVPDIIVVISPHQIMYADYFHISPGTSAVGDFGQFGAGQVRVEVSYDTEFVEELCRQAQTQGVAAGTLDVGGRQEQNLDHGTMVPLYFVNQYWRNYKLVRIGLSDLHLTMHYELGECIQETAEILGRDEVIIDSEDLSHRLKEDGPYGFREDGPEYDSRIMDVMERGRCGTGAI